MIVTFIISLIVGCACWYFGSMHKDDAYIKGLEVGATISRATLAMFNGKIRELEEENDMLRIRLGENTNTDIEDTYISQEGGQD